MKIVEALQDKSLNIRVDHDDRWLYWDEESGMWIVREQKRGQRFSRLVLQTQSEEFAVEALVNG